MIVRPMRARGRGSPASTGPARKGTTTAPHPLIVTIPERHVVAAVLAYLRVIGVPAWRINTAGVPLHDGSGGYRHAPQRGIADILGILPGGRFLAVECKSATGRVTREQAAWLNHVRRAGGVAVVARSAGDVEAALRVQMGGTRP